jgi:hypothetical protein
MEYQALKRPRDSDIALLRAPREIVEFRAVRALVAEARRIPARNLLTEKQFAYRIGRRRDGDVKRVRGMKGGLRKGNAGTEYCKCRQ